MFRSSRSNDSECESHDRSRLYQRARSRKRVSEFARLSGCLASQRDQRGLIPGPRMLVATHGIGATGGHFDDTNGFRDMLFGEEPDWSDGIADGPDAIRKAVRFEVKNGADVIKAAVSGGVLSLADEVDVPQLDPAEMAALVDETHRLRKKVAVHCHGDEAAQGSDQRRRRLDRARLFLETRYAPVDETKRDLSHADADGVGVGHGQDRERIRPAIQAKGKAATDARSEMFRNAVQDRSQDFVRYRRCRLSARTEREGIRAHGRARDETDRCFAQRDFGGCGIVRRRQQARHARERTSWPTSSRCRAIRPPTSPRPSGSSS